MMLGALSVFRDSVDAEIKRLKATVLDQLEEQGADGAPIRLPSGDKIGKASITYKGSESLAVVAHEPAFIEWVASTYPTETETVTRVYGAFQSLLLNRLEDDGNGGAVDPQTGEVVPGVGWATKAGTSRLTTRFDPPKRATKAAAEASGGKERMLAAILAREVEIVGTAQPLALDGGEF